MSSTTVNPSLFDYFNAFTEINDETIQLFKQIAARRFCVENQSLLAEGQVCTSIFLVEKGICRSYKASPNSEDQTVWLAAENEIITSPKGIFLGQPSDICIQAIEPSIVWEIDFLQLAGLQKTNFAVSTVSLQIAFSYILRLESLNNDRRGMSLPENIAWFERNFVGLSGRVKCKYVASFLGTNDSSLSRVKKKIREKEKKGCSKKS